MKCHEKSGDTAAILAVRHDRLDLLKQSCEADSNSLEQANRDGKKPLHEAAQSSRIDCVEYLLHCGVNVDCLKRGDWYAFVIFANY